MANSSHFFSRLAVLAALFVCFHLIIPAQSATASLKNLLRSEAGFQDSDFAALEKGETVIRSLKSEEKREVSICGVIKLQNMPEISLPVLVEKLSQRTNKTVMKWGVFGNPPVTDDLQTLELEDKDLDAMKKCEVGDCDLKMSADMIRRLQNEIDWNAPDHRAKAMQLYRQMLNEYVGDYLRRGDKALLQYDNRKTPVRMADDHRMLLDGALFLDEISPEFGKYLRQFPVFKLSGVENTIDWTKVDFGLKPVLTITHTVSFSFPDNNVTQFLIATKGIYASRYVDSSLALIMLVRESAGDATNAYLVFTNISRSSSLAGLLSGLKRSIVSSESEGKVKDMLVESKAKLLQSVKAPSMPSTSSESSGLSRFGLKPVMILVLVLIAGMAAFLLFRRWRR